MRKTPTRKQLTGNTDKAGGVIHYSRRDKQSQITMSQQQQKGRKGQYILHWEFSNKWFPESYSACFLIHISWQLPAKLAIGGRNTKGYLQAPILKHRISILATGPSKHRAHEGLGGGWSPKQRSQPGGLSAKTPEITCHTMINKVGKDLTL